MRVTSDLWVSALIRRVFAEGGFGAVLRRGAAEAGAIFVIARGRSGLRFFGPAPQASYEDARPESRAFSLLKAETDAEVEARLQREQRFDGDLWVVEIEPGQTPVEELLEIRPA